MNPVDEIKARLDIVDVVSRYVELKRTGRNFKGLCPFHSEKTASFIVFPDTQTWRCFGACAEGGDIYSFLMKRNGWDFAETLRSLAEQTGVTLRPTRRDKAGGKEMERLYVVLDAAAKFFERQLHDSSSAEHARNYIEERALEPDTVKRFRLGYAPAGWNTLRNHLNKLVSDDELVAAGLLSEKHDTGKRFDRFRDRLVVPIRDLRGRVIGFGARALQSDAQPKYLNSPQTPVFDKSNTVFGLYSAKKSIRDKGVAIVVEGYMDVMQGYQTGYPNMVAQMGTALTPQQLRQIKRYSTRMVLALDADVAGAAATMRGLDVAREALDRETQMVFDARGLVRHESRLAADIRIATLPAGYDPDKLMREDLDAWGKAVSDAQPVVSFIIDTLLAQIDTDDPKDKARVVEKALPVIRDVSNAVERDHFRQYLARKLGISERVLSQMAQVPIKPTKRSRRPAVRRPAESSALDERRTGLSKRAMEREQYCLFLVLRDRDVLLQTNRILGHVGLGPIVSTDFVDVQNAAIFSALDQSDELESLWDSVPEALHARLHQIDTWSPGVGVERVSLAEVNHSLDKRASDLAHTMVRLRLDQVKRIKSQLDDTFAASIDDSHDDARSEYRRQMLELQNRRVRLDQALAQMNDPMRQFSRGQ